jgi:hypothetical protein
VSSKARRRSARLRAQAHREENRKATLAQFVVAIGARAAAEGVRELVAQLWRELGRFL